MSDDKCCSCADAPRLIFPCSGASNVGEMADRAGRQLTREGAGKMGCLAAIGRRVSGIMVSTQSAGKILVIDGCPLDCAKNTLIEAGFVDFEHVRVTDLGMVKGGTPVTDDNIEKVALEGASALLK